MAGRIATLSGVTAIAMLLIARWVRDTPSAPSASRPTSSESTVRVTASPRTSRARTWRRPGNQREELRLAEIGEQLTPLSMSLGRDILYLATASGQVIALEIQSNKVLWRVTANSLVSTPRKLVLARAGLLVLGEADRPLIWLRTTTGQAMTLSPIDFHVLVQSGCAVNALVLLSVVDSGPPLLTVDAAGVVRRRDPLPWPELREAHPLQTQVAMAGDDRTGMCVVASRVGDGIAGIDSRGIAWIGRSPRIVLVPPAIVHTTATPQRRVIESRLAHDAEGARDVAAGGGLAYIAAGSNVDGGRVVDTYDVQTGVYVGSFRFTERIATMAAAQDRLAIAAYAGGLPVVRLYVPASR